MSLRILGLALLGVLAFAAVLLVRLPAAWINPLLPAQVSCASYGGTVWHGNCSGLVLQVAPERSVRLDRLEWELEPASLLRGRLAAQVALLQGTGNARAHLSLGAGPRVEVTGLDGQLPVDSQLLPLLPHGWSGGFVANSLDITHQPGGIEHLQGGASLLALQDAAGNPLGSYELRFDETDSAAPFNGALRDLGGPLAVQATVALQSSGAWQIDGRVAPRPEASAGLARQLSALGLPAPDGSYPFSIAGE